MWSASQVCLCTVNDAKWSIQRTTHKNNNLHRKSAVFWNYACALHLLHLLLANKLYHQRGRLGLEIANAKCTTQGCGFKMIPRMSFHPLAQVSLIGLHPFRNSGPQNGRATKSIQSTQYQLEQHHSHITWPTWPDCHACSAGTFSRSHSPYATHQQSNRHVQISGITQITPHDSTSV